MKTNGKAGFYGVRRIQPRQFSRQLPSEITSLCPCVYTELYQENQSPYPMKNPPDVCLFYMTISTLLTAFRAPLGTLSEIRSPCRPNLFVLTFTLSNYTPASFLSLSFSIAPHMCIQHTHIFCIFLLKVNGCMKSCWVRFNYFLKGTDEARLCIMSKVCKIQWPKSTID